MLFLCGCACLYFSDLLAHGYVVMMLNVLRFVITIKKLTDGPLGGVFLILFVLSDRWLFVFQGIFMFPIIVC